MKATIATISVIILASSTIAGTETKYAMSKKASAALTECKSRLTKMMDEILPKAARQMKDGMRVYTPDVGSAYDATWLRDFTYMVESGRVPTDDVVNEAMLFLGKVTADHQGVDCILRDGRTLLKPGGNRMGEKPVLDGCPFTVSLAALAWKQSGDKRFITEPILDKLIRIFDAISCEPNGSGLAWIDPAHAYERCPYGFTDTVRKTGACLFSSLLKYEAAIRLAEMTDAAERPETSTRLREEARRVKASVNRVFWDEKVGLYRAATAKCREHDIWGSAFAVWLGVADDGRADRVARVFRENCDGLVHAGQIRHLLPNVYWEDIRHANDAAVPRDVYQNGAFWGTATGWFCWTLARVDMPRAVRIFTELTADYATNGACECHFAAPRPCPDPKLMRQCPGGYPANIGLPIAALRRMLGGNRTANGEAPLEP